MGRSSWPNRIGRGAVLLAPAGVVAFWGGTYLYATVETLLAPGAGVEVALATPGGALRASAENYAIDPRSGTARLEGLRVVAPDGRLLASVARARVEGLDLAGGLRPKVTLFRPRLTVSRSAKGDLDVAGFLPKSEGPPSDVPFEVIIEEGRLDVRDLAARGTPTYTLRIPEARAAGRSGDLTAEGRLTVQGIGALALSVFRGAAGETRVRGRTEGALDGARLLALVRGAPERRFLTALDGARVGRLDVSGTLDLRLPKTGAKNGRVRFTSNLDARGRGLALRRGEIAERIESASFTGTVTDAGARGSLKAKDGGARASFVGAATYADLAKPAVAGRLEASLASSARIARYLPADVRGKASFAGADFRGWISLREGEAKAQGAVKLGRGEYAGFLATGAKARVAFDGGRLDAREVALTLRAKGGAPAPLAGAATVDLRERTLTASLSAPRLSGGTASGFGAVRGLDLRGGGSALVAGSFDAPRITARLTAGGSYRLPDGTLLSVAPTAIDLAGGLGGGRFGRVALASPFGTVVASGEVGLKTGWNLAVEARGVDLAKLSPDLRGRAEAAGRVVGPLGDPRAALRVEGYGIGTREITAGAVAADVVANTRRVEIAGLTALRGAGGIKASGSLVFRTGAISGRASAEGLQLSDVAGEAAAGTVDVPALKIGGTLARPVARGEIEARGIVAGGLRVPSASARVAADRNGARVADARASVADGAVTGAGGYRFDARSGTFSGGFSGVRPGELLVRAVPQANLGGELSGTYSGTIRGGRLAFAKVEGSASDLTINRVRLGDGALAGRFDGSLFTLDAEVGQLARYLAARGVSYDPATGRLGGKVEILGLPIPEIVAAASPLTKDAPAETRLRLASLEGSVALGAELGGTVESPVIEIGSLGATGLSLGGTNYGDLELAGTYAAGSVDLKRATLKGPSGSLDAAGVVARSGALDLRLEARDLKSELLRPFFPALADARATVENAAIEIGGTARAPEARGSLIGYALLPEAARSFEPRPKEGDGGELAAQAGRFNLNLFDVRATPGASGGTVLAAKGLFSAVGFTGDLAAEVPLGTGVGTGGGAGADAPLSGSVNLRPRPLSQVAAYFPGLAVNKGLKPGAEDLVGGTLTLGGTLARPVADGEVTLAAGRLDYAGLSTGLVDPRLTLSLAGERLDLTASASSSRGGSVAAKVGTPVGDLIAGLAGGRKGDADLLRRPVDGSLTLDGLQVRQGFEGGAYVAARATTVGPIALSGTLREPTLEGKLAVAGLDTVLPTITPGAEAGAALPLDPRFALDFTLTEPARVRSSAADIRLDGAGSLGGSLSSPRANADLALVKGTLRLPGGTVRLEPGGSLDLRYDASAPLGASAARLDTDLVGLTSLTTLRNGGPETERYDITIGVRGDLLAASGDPNALVLTARSDPPGLAQDRILALLGRTDIVTGFLDSRDQRALESQLRSALTGYALPTFLGGFTDSLARDFGFDYLSLDYNAYDQASVVFGRTLGAGFSFSGRRQLSEPQPGLPQRYDVRLQYRPRTGRGYARNLSLSVGADELRPYKLSLEYGTRFGRTDSPLRTYRLGVSKGGEEK